MSHREMVDDDSSSDILAVRSVVFCPFEKFYSTSVLPVSGIRRQHREGNKSLDEIVLEQSRNEKIINELGKNQPA
jgi:hypothetical protein